MAGLSLLFGMNGAPISPEQALARLGASGMSKAAPASVSELKLAYTARTESGVTGAYVFTPANASGFVILSADDMAVPVLGYSSEGRMDADNLPPSLVWWLGEQAARIEYARAKGVDVPAERPYAPADMTVVPVLMTTTWNQDAPYNNDTPLVAGTQSPTGCVATSFAQVMNYFKYPEKGEGTIRYSDSGVIRTLRLGKAFAWDDMLDSYSNGYTEDQAAAVAYLMKACGFSVEMGYGRYASGAQSYKLMNAAVNNFKYDKGTYYTVRELYSPDRWMRLIYDNLKNVGPVIYDGRSIEGGHSFVCDGYDGNGYFHFNWGWGGMSDGYYVLDLLNPESQGIGGYEGGFNNGQGALLGMQPPVEGSTLPEARMRIYGTLEAELDGNIIKFKTTGGNLLGWGNGCFRMINVKIGAVFTKMGESTPAAEVTGGMVYGSGSMIENFSIGPVSYVSTNSANPQVEIPQLADGEYTVTISTKDNEEENAPWIPMVTNWGDPDYCILKVSGGNYTVSSVAPAVLTLEDCSVASPLYFGRNVKIVSTLKNESDKQLMLCYSPVLERDGVIQYEGDNMLVSVNPGQTIEKDAIVRFVQAQNATNTGLGTYTLKVLDRATNNIIGTFGEYEMKNESNKISVTLDDFSVVGATQETVVSGTREFKDVYKFGNGDDFKVNLKYTVDDGYLDSPVRIIGTRYNPEVNKFEALGGNLYSDTPFVGKDDTFDAEIPIDMSAYPAGYVYNLAATYKSNGTNRSMGTISISFSESGIVEITVSRDTDVRYYNMQGVEVENPQPGQIVIRRVNGRTEKIRF